MKIKTYNQIQFEKRQIKFWAGVDAAAEAIVFMAVLAGLMLLAVD